LVTALHVHVRTTIWGSRGVSTSGVKPSIQPSNSTTFTGAVEEVRGRKEVREVRGRRYWEGGERREVREVRGRK
jgi:hypothetical protein